MPTMTDIVKRLRDADISGHGSYSALVRDAADEIERMRALLADVADQRDELIVEYGLFQLPDRPRDDGTVVAVGGEPGASAGSSE